LERHQIDESVLELSMPIEPTELEAFVKRIHIFRGLDDRQVAAVVAELKEQSIQPGIAVIKEGTDGDGLYLIFSGSVQVTRKKNPDPIAKLVKYDYFGETALLTKGKHTATVTTSEPTVVLFFSKVTFQQLLKQAPALRPNFSVVISSYKLAHRLNIGWLRDDEVIYFLATKHVFILAQSLLLPGLCLLLPLFLLIVYTLFPAFTPLLWATGILFLGIGLWIVWKTVDWGNDYYIVTNQRVVYLEKVIGLYDSRQEAPLSTILSVGVETDLWGRQMGFGNVIIRTFVGKIIFHHVSNPNQAATLVEEHWGRARETSRKTESDLMRNEIRKRLGLIQPGEKPENVAAPTVKNTPSFRKGLGSNFMKVRIEKGATITYRKHWFVLFLQTWKPTVMMLVMIFLLVFEILHAGKPFRTLFSSLAVDSLVGIWILAIFGLLLWWIYDYIDWSNDVFQLTPDQILDIDRKPFGTQERKAAPLENILSTDAKREGFWEYLLNYGTVYITVGGSQMSFSDVTDPASVQQDIDNRRLARINAKSEGQARSDRERLADWFAAYHTITDEMNGSNKSGIENSGIEQNGLEKNE
jgi:hypothetical protein